MFLLEPTVFSESEDDEREEVSEELTEELESDEISEKVLRFPPVAVRPSVIAVLILWLQAEVVAGLALLAARWSILVVAGLTAGPLLS